MLTKKQEAFLAALSDNLGIVSKAAHACGLHRNNHANWIKSSPDYKNQAEAIEQDCIDVVENALMDKIVEDRDTTAIIFYLKTKGKQRGYVEKQSVEHSGEVKTGGTIIKWGDKEIHV